LTVLLSSSFLVLERLYCLNMSSPDFPDQLCNILYGREYVQCAPNLQGDDLVRLVDYLNEVRCCVSLPTLRSNLHRHSMVSILAVPLPRSACTNSETHAAGERYSQRALSVRLAFSKRILTRSRREDLVTCTLGPSKVHRFVSNVYEDIARMIKGNQK